MLLGDFETAHFAGSKRRHHVPAPCHRRLRSMSTAGEDDFWCYFFILVLLSTSGRVFLRAESRHPPHC
ncbi:hypothetical protein [Schleiferilactobacillus perolens]|uniref:hypothetical protein n=1 Tax=Schleiferilactobacillus perolens TaxID=100468 RepID=UPI0009F9058E